MIFVPFHREPRPVMGLFVETVGESESMAAAIRDAIATVDPGRPVFAARSMRRIVSDSYAVQRSTLWVAAGLAALALLLMLGGTYAVVSLVTAGRTSEIGLRRALGAGTGDVLATVLGRTCRVAAAGVVFGTIAAVLAAGVLRSQINGVPPLDPAAAAAVAGLVGLAVAAACLAPARRALGIDPAVALRNE
jgi:ABC-type antimicrobial peptide transport system permease subunit